MATLEELEAQLAEARNIRRSLVSQMSYADGSSVSYRISGQDAIIREIEAEIGRLQSVKRVRTVRFYGGSGL
ncbi:hypothetical protein [Pararhodospirillum photometricum]|nr:hypothetical protein [Pararhodospirillum photometricum]